MKRQLIFISAISLGLMGTNALADGMPSSYSAAPSRCGPGLFSGAYIGGALGYANQWDKVTNEIFGTKYKADDSSVTFGGYAGYNWQCDRVVLGVETDINYIDMAPSSSDGSVTLTSKTDWYGTVRARAGLVVHDSLLLYATGGLAYAGVDHTLNDTAAPGGPFFQSDSGTKTGWTLGAGGELVHDSNWLIRAEAFFVDLGSQTRQYTAPAACVSCTSVVKWEDDFWVGRLGLTYKFGPREERVPLK